MHFNWFFSTRAYFKVCIEGAKGLVAIFPCQFLLVKCSYRCTHHIYNHCTHIVNECKFTVD